MVKATVDAASADLSSMLLPLPPVMAVILERQPEEIQVRGGGGVDNCVVIATCYDALGDAVPAGVPVEFSMSVLARTAAKGSPTPWTVFIETRTDESGAPGRILVAGTKIGIVRVAALVGEAYRIVDIAIASGLPRDIQLHAGGLDPRLLERDGRRRPS